MSGRRALWECMQEGGRCRPQGRIGDSRHEGVQQQLGHVGSSGRVPPQALSQEVLAFRR